MGCGQSKAKPQAGGGAFPAPLPPPMQDNMNEILNRWRHGEVNLLQRRFRQARAQAVKNTIASKILGLAAAASAAAAPSSHSGTATSAPSSANNDASLLGEDGSASPASGDVETETADAKKQGDRAAPGAQGGGAGGSGDVGGSARAGLDMAAFWRVFPAVQGLPSDVQRSAYRLFDCVGRGSLDFRNFCRALALCCRGSREERLRFLFDLFSAPSQPKHYGTGADGGPRDAAPFRPGAPAVYVSETELTALKKHLGLSSGDADHAPFQGVSTSASEGRPASSALLLTEYFEWAKAYVSDEALDRALRPFYLLPSPQQEKDKVLAQLTKHTTEEGQWMYLVAASWWRYWCMYAGVSREDLQRIPEASALGLGYTQDSEYGAAPDDPLALSGPRRIGADEEGGNGHGIPFGLPREEGFQGTQQVEVGSGVDTLGAKERAVPTMLARRPHEIDNSSLQGGAEWEVAPDLELGAQYVLLPKPLWDVMMDWYGGGPVFCRRVVKVSVPTERIASVASLAPAITIKKGGRTSSAGDVRDGDTSHADNILVIDLYPLALHVSQCDLSGRPSGRERLVLTSHHVTVNDMLSEVLQISRVPGIQRPFSELSGPHDAPVPSADEGNGSGEATGTREREGEGGDGHEYEGRGGEQAAGEQTAGDQTAGCQAQGGGADKLRASERMQSVRLWVLETIPSGLIDMPHTVTSRPKFGLVGGGVGGVNQNQQAGGVKRWKLVNAEEEGMTLSTLGFVGGENVMLETQVTDSSTDDSWPRHRYIEEPNFRDFREGDRLDAMDYQGRWFSGQVVAVVEVVHKSVSKIVDSEGPVGRKKSKSRSRPQQQDQDRHRPERSEAPESMSSRVSSAAGGSGGNSGMITRAPRSRGSSTSSSKTGSASKYRGSSGEVDVAEGSSAAVGSRKRMRIRVSFDRFASQWDEWYDSKSVKLAPEASHTAPAVVVQTIKKPESTGNNKEDSVNIDVGVDGGHAPINNSKPREEPAASDAEPREAQAEAQEETSPTVPLTKPGASSASSSNPSRGGGGAYPPPVGRFTGDASGGNSWNTRLPLNTTFGPPRPNAAVPSGNADGISNYGGVTLNRRSNTPGKPPVPGACGLVNVGNTCYLNSAIQCLSHTPLLRAYLLSDMWEAEVNKYNPLGTQGKLVEDFASLLKSLWSQEYLCFFPSKFKRGLIKYKQQFSGNEQQDSQEFLAVMLDALHEDVNRVIEKPYQPQTDEAESNRSDQELADEAWDGHVQRNRSVIVDLFQGQLKMECRCPVCDKKSVTFDPFMYLSVPIPTRNEKMVRLVLLPRIRCRDIYVSTAGSGGGGAGDASGADGEVVEFSNPRQLVPVQYGMMLPRMGEVMDLKRELSELCGIPPSFLVIATASQHNLRILPSKEPLTNVREDDTVLAYVVGGTTLYERSHMMRGQSMAEPPAETAPSNGRPGTADVAQVGAVVGVSNGEGGEVSTEGQGKGDSNNNDMGTGNGQGQGVGGSSTGVESGGDRGDAAADTGVEEDELTDLDDDRPPVPDSKVDRRSPDERCMEQFPSYFRDLENGWRLDALDKEGGWYPSTIIEVSKSSDKRERQIRVHFDGFMSKWDEFYGEHEWKEGKLAPLYSKTQADERLIDIQVVHRKIYKVMVSSPHPPNESVLHRGNGISTGHGLPRDGQRRSDERDGRDGRDQAAPVLYTTAKDLFGLPFVVRCPPDRSARYLWRLVVQQASRFVAGSSGSTKFRPARSRDRMAKAAAGASGRRANVTAAWVARAAAGKVSGMTDEKLSELLPFTVKLVLRNSPLLDTVSTDLLPDRWRAVSSLICSKLILALEWKDSSRDYLNVEMSTFDHPSYLELETNAQSAQSGLTLEQCLDAYTREETLGEEDSWFCSGCRAHRRGVMKIDLWKMPDVLVMHMKRFQCSARWREKIRTLVVFPHSGLDMSGFVSSNSAHRNQVGGGQGGMVYDLFGVVNHIGGMTGGHYTAYCRSSPCSKDGVEEVTGWGLEHPWLHFDDEFVEEIAPDKIVSEAAYVLFYRRRRLTPSNVINMTI